MQSELWFQAHLALESKSGFRLISGLENAEWLTSFGQGADKKAKRFFLAGIVLALLIWGLQLIGVYENLRLGGPVLAAVFALCAYLLWTWEGFSRFHLALRVTTLALAATIYFGLIGRQMLHQYKQGSNIPVWDRVADAVYNRIAPLFQKEHNKVPAKTGGDAAAPTELSAHPVQSSPKLDPVSKPILPASNPCGPISAISSGLPAMPGADSVTVLVTRSSSASGANVRAFTTTGGGSYEIDMQVPDARPQELQFTFATDKAITVNRNGTPHSLRASGHPLTIEGFTDRGFRINDSGCAGILYKVVWMRGEISNKQNAPSVTNNAPGGIANSGTIGQATVINNPAPAERTWELSIAKCDEWMKRLDALGRTEVSVGAFVSNNDGARIVRILGACFERSQNWKAELAVLPANPDGVEIGASESGPKLDAVEWGLGELGLRVTKRDIRSAYGTEIGIIVGTNPIKQQR